ncbi:MAG: hypothetical protein AAF443_05605, partial [Chlamydiota bacterium]
MSSIILKNGLIYDSLHFLKNIEVDSVEEKLVEKTKEGAKKIITYLKKEPKTISGNKLEKSLIDKSLKILKKAKANFILPIYHSLVFGKVDFSKAKEVNEFTGKSQKQELDEVVKIIRENDSINEINNNVRELDVKNNNNKIIVK